METLNTGKLRNDLLAVVTDAEELLKATASQTGEGVERIRARAEQTLRAARVRLEQVGAAVEESALEAAREVDGRVRDNPWAAVGVATAVGVLIGILLSRR